MNKKLVLLTAALLLLVGCKGKGGESSQPVAHDGKSAETAFTLDEMIEEMKDYTGGQISKEEYYVKGKMATGTTYDIGHTSWSGYGEGHAKDSEKPFQFYSCQMDESITKNYRDDGCLDGATVVVKGYVQLYVKDDNPPVYEICYLSASKSPTGEATSPVILSVEGGQEFVPPQPTAMAIGSDFQLAVSATKQLVVEWTPSNAQPQAVTWTSSDPTKATVVDGLVTGVAAGSATITAQAGSLSASVTVTVLAAVKEFDLTAASLLGYTGTNVAYGDGSDVDVNGVKFSFNECGAYGSGIQMRVKDGKSSKVWNNTVFASRIQKIDITLNSGKAIYDNTDVWEFKFGTSAAVDGETIKLSTVKDQKTYTVTPEGTTFKYFSMTKIIESYTFYVDSILITLA